MNLDLLAGVLQTASLGTVGTDIFIHRMPADCSAGIMLRNPLAGIPVDHDIPGYFRGEIQVIVRNPHQTAGDIKAKAVSEALSIYNQDFTNGPNLLMTIQRLVPMHLPIVYPRSVGQEIEWSLNFDAVYILY